jgi:hypothetical protein
MDPAQNLSRRRLRIRCVKESSVDLSKLGFAPRKRPIRAKQSRQNPLRRIRMKSKRQNAPGSLEKVQAFPMAS